MLRGVTVLAVFAWGLLGCGDDDDDHAPADAGADAAADAAPDGGDTDAGREAWACACDGDEDCSACLANIGACCYEGDETIGGQAERLAATCRDDGACAACCDECADKTCDELVQAGACPPVNVTPWPWTNGLAIDNGVFGIVGAGALSTEGLAANPGLTAQLGDPNFHKIVSYLVQCALPPEAVVHVGDEDLPGGIGLAPEWADGPCEEACQEWVSACMLSRTNTYGVTVSLYLASQNPGMLASADEGEVRLSELEGSYYGNLFIEPPVEYVCRGEGHDPLLGTFRVCAAPGNRCGIQVVGPCGAVDGDTQEPSTRHACEGFDPETGTYERCHDRASLAGSDEFPAGTRTYERIFTTYVQRTAFQEGYADACEPGDPIPPFAPDDVPGLAGATCDNDDDCAIEQGFHCDARNNRGFCTKACMDSADPGAEEAECGDGATCSLVSADGAGLCASACTPRTRGGDCDTGRVCTTQWLFLGGNQDQPACRDFCSSDADCPPHTPCTRFGGCGGGVDMDALADGEPCFFPEGSDYPEVPCRGACVRYDADPSHGHCASLINLAVTRDCPDQADMPLLTNGDDVGVCAYKRCTGDEDCTAPMVCIDTPRGLLCDFPPP